jgi:hypothetical protein
MNEVLNEKVSVITVYNYDTGLVMPKRLKWHGREYTLTQLGYHHRVRYGRTLMHIFHVTDGSTTFRLRFDTDTLHWILEEVYNELAA